MAAIMDSLSPFRRTTQENTRKNSYCIMHHPVVQLHAALCHLDGQEALCHTMSCQESVEELILSTEWSTKTLTFVIVYDSWMSRNCDT